MAKMFYTIEEVCQKLGKTDDEVREMVSSGQIQEFRDREKLMFKVEQIDLLAGDEDTGDVHLDLEDTSGQSGLELSGSGISLADSQDGTGISVFDTDHGSPSDFDDGSEVGATVSEEDDLNLDAIGSGSGLLDLTRESDDTSLGAELLEELYSGEENIEIPANASGLFEAASADPVHEEAVAAFRKALFQAPNNGWALYGLSKAQAAAGNRMEARAASAKLDEIWQGETAWLSMDRL